MSAVRNRRVRDSNAGSGRKSSKALTPVSAPNKNPNGKENPKLVCRALGSGQKPVIRSVPRVEKAALGCGGNSAARQRFSTSSAPKGRSPSPSDIFRCLSDAKREKGPKACVGGSAEALGMSTGGSWTSDLLSIQNDSKKNIVSVKPTWMASEEFARCGTTKIDICTDGLRDSSLRGSADSTSKSDADTKVRPYYEEKSADCNAEKFGRVVQSVSKKTHLDCHVKVSDTLQGKGSSEGSCKNSSKYPSKLHEKLAFLEGKVKRIASDIKKTKDMLDDNNPDSSKLILSDIQEKISGIEQAMSAVVNNSGSRAFQTRRNEDVAMEELEIPESNSFPSRRCSVKGLNNEELENRLFPHHKLLRDRKFSKASSEGTREHGREKELNQKKLRSPVEENLVALEFLASVENDRSETANGEKEPTECQGVGGEAGLGNQDSSKTCNVKPEFDMILTTDEKLDDFDDEEQRQEAGTANEDEETLLYELNEVGWRTSTGGWFVSEGEAVLLVHDDGSCSYYDVANREEKSMYKPPGVISPNLWRDCWIIRAPGADGCSGKYVVAASAGKSLESGFCSWDFYTKDVHAFRTEGGANPTPRTPLGPLVNNTQHRRSTLSRTLASENHQWWYRPCGPLIASTATSQKTVNVYDIRDGEQMLTWNLQKPVISMDYSSPIQWRNRGKLAVAGSESISVWDVNSLLPQALLSVNSCGRKILAFHISNTDAEIGGGVRQRVSSSEAEGHDGVMCTEDAINVLDFRNPSGIGMKIQMLGVSTQSVFSRGDSIFLGCTSSARSTLKKRSASQIQELSLRMQGIVKNYYLPESSSQSDHSALTQVWGNSNFVMGVSVLGLHVFDAINTDRWGEVGSTDNSRGPIGPDDMDHPTFDYSGSRVLLVAGNRPAMWRRLV